MPHDETRHPAERLTDLAHLASAVGHHVINAFAAIVSNAEVLKMTAGTESAADPLATADLIIRTAVEAAGVARQLINVTRPITATGDERVDLARLAAEVAEEARAAAPPGVLIAAELGPVPPVKGHAPHLRSMLGHLITNARDALPATGGTITLATATDDRGWAVLEVRDTGYGLAPGVQERALEPFFSTKRGGHLGIGLSIANGIWRRHRGTLAILSRFGEGVTLRMCADPNL